MNKLILFIILAVTLLATVPWFFTKHRHFHLFGFPPWAFYTLCLTIVYAIVVTVFTGRYWSLSANDNDDEKN